MEAPRICGGAWLSNAPDYALKSTLVQLSAGKLSDLDQAMNQVMILAPIPMHLDHEDAP